MKRSESREEAYMRLAIQKAAEGMKHGQTPFGACIVKAGTVVSCAHNEVWDTGDVTAHAEMQAIRQACATLHTIDLSGCTLYSTCEPCPMCFSASHWARIDTIVFGSLIADAQRIGFNELRISAAAMQHSGHSQLKLRGGCLRKETLALLHTWAVRGDRHTY